MILRKWSFIVVGAVLVWALKWAVSPVQADGSYAILGTSTASNGGADAVNWSAEFPLMIDAYGKYIGLGQKVSVGYFIEYSNDKGSTWSESNQATYILNRPAAVYDSISDKLHILYATSSGEVVYRRFTISRDREYNIMGFARDTTSTMVVDSVGGCTSAVANNPHLLLKNTGTYGTLVGFWFIRKTCSGVTVGETRASMRVLTNSSADFTGGNWAALDGSGDSGGAYAASIAYDSLYSFTGSTGGDFQHTAIIRGGSGSKSEDIYYFNSDGNTTNGFRRLGWSSGSGNWSGSWTSRATFGGNVDDTNGYNLKHELLTKAVYDDANDRVYVAIARWLDGTNGDTQSLFYVDASDNVTLASNVYSAMGAHCLYPTVDIAYDSVTDKVYIFYDKTGTALQDCGHAYYKTYDGSSLSSETAFYSLTGRSVDIPVVYESRYNDQLLLFFRLNNASSPNSTPHDIYFGTVALSATATPSPPVSVSGGTNTDTTRAQFEQACEVKTNTQVLEGSGGEVATKSSLYDDFRAPTSPYTGVFYPWNH
jgi:hypothetical protein